MSTMEELTNLQNKVAEQKIEDAEANVDNFGTTEKEELTDAEKETLKELEAKYGEKPILVVNDTDANGNTTQIPAKDYIKSLDKKTTPVTTEEASDQMDKLIKTVNSGDIKKNMDNLKEEARARTLEAFRTLAVAMIRTSL